MCIRDRTEGQGPAAPDQLFRGFSGGACLAQILEVGAHHGSLGHRLGGFVYGGILDGVICGIGVIEVGVTGHAAGGGDIAAGVLKEQVAAVRQVKGGAVVFGQGIGCLLYTSRCV